MYKINHVYDYVNFLFNLKLTKHFIIFDFFGYFIATVEITLQLNLPLFLDSFCCCPPQSSPIPSTIGRMDDDVKHLSSLSVCQILPIYFIKINHIRFQNSSSIKLTISGSRSTEFSIRSKATLFIISIFSIVLSESVCLLKKSKL